MVVDDDVVPVELEAVLVLDVAAQVEFESKVFRRFIIF